MNVKVEQLGDKNMYRLIIEASAEEVENGIERAYKKVRGQVNVPGFRKGKAPRKIIEQMYGKTVFYNDAADEIVLASSISTSPTAKQRSSRLVAPFKTTVDTK